MSSMTPSTPSAGGASRRNLLKTIGIVAGIAAVGGTAFTVGDSLLEAAREAHMNTAKSMMASRAASYWGDPDVESGESL